jgi:Mg2+ and Co2+ transporter CorA
MTNEHEHEGRQEKLLRELLKIETHEDRMIAAMVQLGASSERLNRRLAGLTWVMLVLTWVTFIVAIPNTLATIFGIPKVSETLGIEVMISALIISTVGALLIIVLPRSIFSISNLEKRSEKRLESD